MSSRRPERVAEAMREVLSELILREIKDPRVGMITITSVEVTPDLRHAKVYFSCVGDEAQRDRTLTGLSRAAGFLRRELTRQLHLRYAPDLRFLFDRGIEEAEHMAQVLRGLGRDRDGES